MSRSDKQNIPIADMDGITKMKGYYDLETGEPTGLGHFIELLSDTLISCKKGKYSICLPYDYKEEAPFFANPFILFKGEIRQLITMEPSPQHKQFIIDDIKFRINDLNTGIFYKKNKWLLKSLNLCINSIEGYNTTTGNYFLLRRSVCKEAINFLNRLKKGLENLHSSAFINVPLGSLKEVCSLNPFFELDILFEDIEKATEIIKSNFFAFIVGEICIDFGDGRLVSGAKILEIMKKEKIKSDLDDYINVDIKQIFNRAFTFLKEYVQLNNHEPKAFDQIGSKIQFYNTKLMSTKELDENVFGFLLIHLSEFYNCITTNFKISEIFKEEFGPIVSSINLNHKYDQHKIETFIEAVYIDRLFDVPNKIILQRYFTGGTVLSKINWNLQANEYNFFFLQLCSTLYGGKQTNWQEIEKIFHHNSVLIRKCTLGDKIRKKILSNYFNVFTS